MAGPHAILRYKCVTLRACLLPTAVYMCNTESLLAAYCGIHVQHWEPACCLLRYTCATLRACLLPTALQMCNVLTCTSSYLWSPWHTALQMCNAEGPLAAQMGMNCELWPPRTCLAIARANWGADLTLVLMKKGRLCKTFCGMCADGSPQ
jgi:hypothetical protein